jgi:hypothetical protein
VYSEYNYSQMAAQLQAVQSVAAHDWTTDVTPRMTAHIQPLEGAHVNPHQVQHQQSAISSLAPMDWNADVVPRMTKFVNAVGAARPAPNTDTWEAQTGSMREGGHAQVWAASEQGQDSHDDPRLPPSGHQQLMQSQSAPSQQWGDANCSSFDAPEAHSVSRSLALPHVGQSWVPVPDTLGNIAFQTFQAFPSNGSFGRGGVQSVALPGSNAKHGNQPDTSTSPAVVHTRRAPAQSMPPQHWGDPRNDLKMQREESSRQQASASAVVNGSRLERRHPPLHVSDAPRTRAAHEVSAREHHAVDVHLFPQNQQLEAENDLQDAGSNTSGHSSTETTKFIDTLTGVQDSNSFTVSVRP